MKSSYLRGMNRDDDFRTSIQENLLLPMKALLFSALMLPTLAHATFQYVSPRPGSILHPVEKHIILREGDPIDVTSLQADRFRVSGSLSGDHALRVVLSSDGKTILLYPVVPFSHNEVVTVEVFPGLRTTTGKIIDGFVFSFTTKPYYSPEQYEQFRAQRHAAWLNELRQNGYDPALANETADTRDVKGQFEIKKNTNPSAGYFFYDAWSAGILGNSKWDGYYIISNAGDSIYGSPKQRDAFDFSLNPNGYLSCFNEDYVRWDVIDSNMNVVDYYYIAPGYEEDLHEFTIYENGHAWMIVQEFNVMDLTVYDPSYHPSATVMTTLIHELDADKNVIWEWRGFDHVLPTECNQNLKLNFVDVIHTNSIELDANGNVLASHRHLNQVTLIDYATGEFIWRLGGVNNQFTFINNSESFNFQHDARFLPNGNITLWDNGNAHVPPRSRAKEYALDLDNMTAELVWSFQPKTYTGGNAYWFAMGSLQRLPNGNSVINGGWDYSSNQSNFYEVTPDGTVVWELALQNSKSLVSYRVRKFIWKPCAPISVASVQVSEVTDSTAFLSWNPVANAVSYEIGYRIAGDTIWTVSATTHTELLLTQLLAGQQYEYQIRALCANGFSSDETPVDTFTTTGGVFTSLEGMSVTLLLYPNPADDQFTIKWADDLGEVRRLLINDTRGRLWRDQSLLGQQVVDVGDLPAGVYFVRLIGDGYPLVQRLIRQ